MILTSRIILGYDIVIYVVLNQLYQTKGSNIMEFSLMNTQDTHGYQD